MIANRYLSALGNNVPSLVVIILLVFNTACGREDTRTLDDGEFQQIYGDILFLGELYRQDSTALHAALDSLLDAHTIDTTVLFETAREIIVDKQRSDELYRGVIERYEARIAPPDTGVHAGDSLPQAADPSERRAPALDIPR
ncbi:MAG: hypothetical protein KFH87_12175 [Bacteroidetes bacterium]|nr:hypothetical protein [Bacteroidota bacterium]